MKLRLKTLAAGLLAMGTMMAAQASPIDDFFTSRNSTTYLLQDLSGEIVIDGNGDAGDIGTNDILFGALGFESFSNPQSSIPVSGRELTGLFATKVTSSAAVTASTADFLMGAAGAGFWTTALGATQAAALTGLGIDLDKVSGLLFEDVAGDFDRGDGITAGLANAGDGVLRAVIGFDGVDDFWFARGFSSLASFATPGASTTNAVGQFNFGQSFLYENIAGDFLSFGTAFTQDDLDSGGYLGSTIIGPVSATVQLAGDGSLFRPSDPNPGVTDPFPVYNKVDITLSSVPEPGTIALLGLGLLGMSVLRRKGTRA